MAVDRLNNLFQDSVSKETLLDLEEVVKKKAEKGDIMRLDDQIQFDLAKAETVYNLKSEVEEKIDDIRETVLTCA